jgi:hypothetical protein
MIVKNESKIIERCLDGVKDIVDYISISDNCADNQQLNFLYRTEK